MEVEERYSKIATSIEIRVEHEYQYVGVRIEAEVR